MYLRKIVSADTIQRRTFTLLVFASSVTNCEQEPDRRNITGMPNHKSAEKRDRQNQKRNEINSSNRTRLRSQIRKLRELIEKGTPQDALQALPGTISVIDKSVQKGVLHRNAAARHKARLTAHVNERQAK
jgi:small subunit ribosomal protein S20